MTIENTEESRKNAFDVEKEAARWEALALWEGFNKLALNAETLRERILCRIARESALDQLMKLGIDLVINRDAVIVTLPSKRPWIELTTADYELMCKALAEHDALFKNPIKFPKTD